MPKTIFEKIINKELKADIVYEDDLCLAFHDVNPQAPIHVLLICKKVIPRLADVQEADAPLLGHLMVKATEIAAKLNISENFRLVINNGPEAGQSIYHLHLHILSGRLFHWPPG